MKNIDVAHVKKIYENAQLFRCAILKCDKAFLPITFENFPRGSCGDTCLLLGTYFDKIGLGIADYVTGENGHLVTHAWLELDGLIIDITADQFDNFLDEVFVKSKDDSDFHKQFLEDIRYPYFESLDNGHIENDFMLAAAYNYIVSKVNDYLKTN